MVALASVLLQPRLRAKGVQACCLPFLVLVSITCGPTLLAGRIRQDVWQLLPRTKQPCRYSVVVAMVRAKLEWPIVRPLTKKQKENIQKCSTGLAVNLPRDGRCLGPKGANIAVEDLNQLASEPVRLRLDRTGKTVREDEVAEASVPWSSRDVFGMNSATAPLSWEVFEARYRSMDKTMLPAFGDRILKEVQKLISAEDGKDDYRTVRTFSWHGENVDKPSTVMLIGVSETSARSRQLAARAVFEADPSALLVQLCREQIGRQLVMPVEHRVAVANYARGYSASNPHRLRRELYMIDVLNGDYESLKLWMSGMAYGRAVDEFV